MGQETEFLSWDGVLAVSAMVIFLGHFVDWALREAKKEAILQWLRGREEALKAVPIGSWQVIVAKRALLLWTQLGRFPLRLLRIEKGFRGVLQIWRITCSLVMLQLLLMKLGALPPFLSVALAFVSLFYGPMIVLAVFSSVIIMLYEDNEELSPFTERLFFEKTVPSAFLSSWATLLAVSIGLSLQSEAPIPNAIIGISRASGDSFSFAVIVSCSNYAFDLVAVLVSMFLLRRIVDRERGVAWYAAADVFISSILSIVLYGIVTAFEDDVSQTGVEWFKSLILLQLDTHSSDYRLTPLLLTTFIPVALYGGAILLLGLVIGPGLRIAGYFAGLLGEKENTPFKELAILFGLLIATIKALTEWSWLLSFLS